MSGWDEGNVFYSDQNLEDGGDENGDKLVTRHSSQRKFKEFIRSYGDIKGPFPYRYVCESSFSYLCVCVCGWRTAFRNACVSFGYFYLRITDFHAVASLGK
jgi:hypothetical protein